jgi:outer membrane protease
MRPSLISHCLAMGGLLLAASGGAHAQSPDFWQQESFWGGPAEFSRPPSVSYTSPDDTVRINASIGAMFLQGNEYVFIGNSTLSHLIWQSTAPVLRGSVAVDVGSGFSVGAEGSLAGFGSSYMEDYDWQIATTSFDNWTDRSQHPDTDLDHYWTGAAVLGFELVKDETAVVRVHGGIKYTDVQWSAYGGSYIYSRPGFRDTVGNFADGEPAIRYRQQLPEIFLGFDGEERYGNIRLGGLLRGGLTVLAQTRDNHWMGDRLVVDTLRVAPTFSAGADVGFALGPLAELYIAARYDQMFQMRGRAEYFDSGVRTIVGDDLGGADFRSIEVTAGLRGTF